MKKFWDEPKIMSFTREEKETICHFDYAEQMWLVTTSVPSHITKCLKRYDCIVDYVGVNGNPTQIRCELPKSAISFRTLSKVPNLEDEAEE